VCVVFAALGGAVALAHGQALATQAQASGGCTLEPTSGTKTRLLGARSYELHVPPGLSGQRVPLLLTMHGLSSWGREHEWDTRWSQFADGHGFIVAYPNGLANSWNFRQDSYDVSFLRAVAGDIASTWCVDPDRVYASGHSNGAFMAQRLACDAPDVFAAVTEYAGGSPQSFGTPCQPSRGVSVGLFHGDADVVVSPAFAERARDQWVARDGCAPASTSDSVPEGVLLRWHGCRDDAEVIWRSYPGQSHLWPTGVRGDDIRSRMWAFLTAHPRP
jgi:polyhydroxybutyrate depolymerase